MSEKSGVNQLGPSTKFEFVIQKAFNCEGKLCDPLKFAAQDHFDNFGENSERFHSGKAYLAYAIGAFVQQNPEHGKIERINALFNDLIEASNQDEIIEVIDGLLAIFDAPDE